MPTVPEKEARRVYQEMVAEELEFLQSMPELRVWPHPFGDSCLVRECDLSTLEALARRETEKAVERTLRNKDSTTCA